MRRTFRPADDDPHLRRVRQPPPLLKRRLPSGRGATEQPNMTGEGEARLTPAFWLALALTGVATGLFGDLMMWVLFSFEHLAFHTAAGHAAAFHAAAGHAAAGQVAAGQVAAGQVAAGHAAASHPALSHTTAGPGQPGDFQSRVEQASDLHRVLALVIAGAFAGPAWYLLRRWTRGERSDVEESVWTGRSRLSFQRGFLTGLISEMAIGMGASLGRESAPRVMGGISGDKAASWLGLNDAQRRLLIACGAGAGLAAVYNVPLGGALFAAELIVGSVALPTVLPALACSGIATGVAWIYLPQAASYTNIPDYRFSGSLMIWAVVVGPVTGLLASAYIRLIGLVSHYRLEGKKLIFGPLVAFGAVGLIGMAYPALFGNGKDMAHRAFLGQGAVVALLALFLLKPLVTAACLGSGASGGLFTPFMSTGAVFGAFAGKLWLMAWPGPPLGAFAVVGAAAMLGSSTQAPLSGLVLVLELTHSGFHLMVPVMVATFLATEVARRVDGYSIYSARLPGY